MTAPVSSPAIWETPRTAPTSIPRAQRLVNSPNVDRSSLRRTPSQMSFAEAAADDDTQMSCNQALVRNIHTAFSVQQFLLQAC